MKTATIYALCDATGPRYVGKSTNPKARFLAHLSDAANGRPDARAQWIASMLDAGTVPTLRVLEVVPHDEWPRAERHWITTLREQGVELTNVDAGGGGFDWPDSMEKPNQAGVAAQVPVALRKAIDDKAERLGISLSDAVRAAVSAWVKS